MQQKNWECMTQDEKDRIETALRKCGGQAWIEARPDVLENPLHEELEGLGFHQNASFSLKPYWIVQFERKTLFLFERRVKELLGTD